VTIPLRIRAEPLTPEAFALYGAVLDGDRPELPYKSANMGTARRYDWVAPVENLRPGAARPNLCIFRVAPRLEWPLEVKMLEHHPLSTQLFFPMAASRYVVLVAAPRPGSPDLSTLRAFLATARQGVAYVPGTWHHPLIALDRETDFGCIVYEDETVGDCHDVSYAEGARPIVELA
jgi:ureidoglycolate lyase